MKRRDMLRRAVALTAAGASLRALAQARPATIRFIVPYPAGGAADQMSRLVANGASTVLGTPIVIENRGGAGGILAADAFLHTEPNGATFFVGANAPIVINQAMYEKLPYDPVRDFVPVVGMGKAPLLLVTRKDLGANDLPSFIALAKGASGGGFNMGSASSGNITHLAGEYAANRMGFKVTHVPFAGSAPAITSLMGGNIDIMFDALPSCMQPAKAGRIVPLVLLDSQRFPQIPYVPTAEEAGIKGLEAAAWFGVMASNGTPPALLDAMNKAVNEALKRPDLIERLHGIGAQPMPGSAAQFAQFIEIECKLWLPIARQLGVRAE